MDKTRQLVAQIFSVLFTGFCLSGQRKSSQKARNDKKLAIKLFRRTEKAQSL